LMIKATPERNSPSTLFFLYKIRLASICELFFNMYEGKTPKSEDCSPAKPKVFCG